MVSCFWDQDWIPVKHPFMLFELLCHPCQRILAQAFVTVTTKYIFCIVPQVKLSYGSWNPGEVLAPFF